MKKKYYAALLVTLSALSSSFLCAMDVDPKNHVTVRFHNGSTQKDGIGPAEGGDFLEKQKWIADGNVVGNQPGDGLFLIPPREGVPQEEPAHALFDLRVDLLIVTKDGKSILHPTKEEKTSQDRAFHLKLPGETTEVILNINPNNIAGVFVKLKSPRYSYTTTGGNLWVPSDDITLCRVGKIILPGESAASLDVMFSWPSDRSGKLEGRFGKPDDSLGAIRLVNNWKQHIGLNTSRRPDERPHCAPTRYFTVPFLNEELGYPGIRSKLSLYAGHPLFRGDPETIECKSEAPPRASGRPVERITSGRPVEPIIIELPKDPKMNKNKDESLTNLNHIIVDPPKVREDPKVISNLVDIG